MRRTSAAFVPVFTLSMLVSAAAPSQSAITVYTSQASFLAAAPPGTALVANFETRAVFPPITGPFTEGGLSFSSPLNNMAIVPAGYGAFNPPPPSKMLSANGNEDISVVVNFGTGLNWTYALGFALLTNQFAPGTITLFDEHDVVLATYQPTQAPNTLGFVGFVGTYPSRIAKMRWLAVQGNNQNTALDNFHTESHSVTPARSTSWGRVKSLYRD